MIFEEPSRKTFDIPVSHGIVNQLEELKLVMEGSMSSAKKVVTVIYLIFIGGLVFSDSMDSILYPPLKKLINPVEENLTIGIGNIVLSDKNIGSEFSSYVSERIELVLTEESAVSVVNRNNMDQIIDEITLELSGLFDDEAGSMTGELKVVDTLITGKYYVFDEIIELYLDLLSIRTAVTLNTVKISIPKGVIPSKIALYPDNYNKAKNVIKEISGILKHDDELVLKVWTSRGDGGVYFEGENLIVNLIANKNCYVKIYHIDVEGQYQLIFPNEYFDNNYISSETIYKIPDGSYPFNFELEAPYGTEL